jgi:hypothetical protein
MKHKKTIVIFLAGALAITMTIGAAKIMILQENAPPLFPARNLKRPKQEKMKTLGRKAVLPEAPRDAPEEHST